MTSAVPRDAIAAGLARVGYVADRDLATALWMMEQLKRPLLLEGEAGVGKTEVAKALAALHGCELIRMQCYEGLDASSALYEWNYQRQLLAIKAREGSGASVGQIEAEIFSESYLLERPLLQAIRREVSPVLLVDEVDRADEEFEAFLLELLSDFQITIPEFGTIAARTIPRVVLTSNGTRELSDALRRRCLYHYIDFPDVDREAAIILMRQPGIDAALALQVARMVAMLRKEDLRKVPGVAETLDWAATLAGLGVEDLRQDPEIVHDTLIAILKTQEDRVRVSPETTAAPARQGGVNGRARPHSRHAGGWTRPGDARAPRRLRTYAARRGFRDRPPRTSRRRAYPCDAARRPARTAARGAARAVLVPTFRSRAISTSFSMPSGADAAPSAHRAKSLRKVWPRGRRANSRPDQARAIDALRPAGSDRRARRLTERRARGRGAKAAPRLLRRCRRGIFESSAQRRTGPKSMRSRDGSPERCAPGLVGANGRGPVAAGWIFVRSCEAASRMAASRSS